MNRQALHNLALTLHDSADFIRSHTEPRITILNEDGYIHELRGFADTAVTSAKAIQRALTRPLTGGAQ